MTGIWTRSAGISAATVGIDGCVRPGASITLRALQVP